MASWNDTSGKARQKVELQARVRQRLASAAAAASAATSASISTSSAMLNSNNPETLASTTAGRKRPRTTAASTPAYLGWPSLTELRAGGVGDDGGDDAHGSRCGGREHADAVVSSMTDSSLSCSTSGSESDSSCSYASVMSHQNLPWRRPEMVSREAEAVSAGAAAAVVGMGGGEEVSVGGSTGSVSASASASSDTDSEYCSDLISPPSISNSDASSCSGVALAGDVPGVGVGDAVTGAMDEALGKHGEIEDEEEQQRCTKRRNVVRVRLARSQMPSRFAEPAPEFHTCLKHVLPEDRLGTGVEGQGNGGDGTGAGAMNMEDAVASAAVSMMGLCEGDGVDAQTWLTSGFIDVVMAKFARTYPNVHFMPVEFAALCLRGWGADAAAPPPPVTVPSPASGTATADGSGNGAVGNDRTSSTSAAAAAAALSNAGMRFKDVLGHPIVYSEKRPVIFLTNVNNVHWNLLRVEHDPVPELQLFEPMGKPPRRQGASRAHQAQQNSGFAGRTGILPSATRGTGFRCIPKEVYRWLDTVWPLGGAEYSTACSGAGSGGVCASGGSGSSSSSTSSGSRKRPRAPSAFDGGGWASHAYSAITRQQQTTGFDCGVAALLYAEKCGQDQMREDVDAWTTQQDMTEYRRALQVYVEEALRQHLVPSPSSVPVDRPPPPPPDGAGTPEVSSGAQGGG